MIGIKDEKSATNHRMVVKIMTKKVIKKGLSKKGYQKKVIKKRLSKKGYQKKVI
ncbi:hypothetical protein [Methanosarcina sp. UBA289]|uniref:hypothetical protein n=1 Tax=Methanosarcina sp. UBA289 TaxID=1915574 RepID=UPI0025D85495|nr:hypothetical protein [Methanosarcina sp. UBA289]